MNCFEARKEFAAFWRRTLPRTERELLAAHLASCTQCDRSFRIFALSAPVIHSQSEPERSSGMRPPLSLVRPHRFATVPATVTGRRRAERPWRVAAAAVALLMIGGISAWSAVRLPSEIFAESAVADTSDVDAAVYPFGGTTGIDAASEEPTLFDSIAPDFASIQR